MGFWKYKLESVLQPPKNQHKSQVVQQKGLFSQRMMINYTSCLQKGKLCRNKIKVFVINCSNKSLEEVDKLFFCPDEANKKDAKKNT